MVNARFLLVTFSLFATVACRPSAPLVEAATLSCAAATTLDELSGCIIAQMPPEKSNGYIPPTAQERLHWRTVVRAMLEGKCDAPLPGRLAGIMQLRAFDDRSNGRRYCVLMEVLDANADGRVDRGWGTLIVDPRARRELHHHAPHAVADPTTEREALAIFRETESRGYLMSGAHRYANSDRNRCQTAYAAADMAHASGTMFQATNEELMAFYGARTWWALQWHGMGAYECNAVNVYLSHGRNAAPSPADKIAQLKSRLLERHPSWKVDVPGTGACTLNGTFNTQGRLLNGVPSADVCTVAAKATSGRFLHIEQDPNYRSPADWVGVVREVWPAR